MFEIETGTLEGAPCLRLSGELTIYAVTAARPRLSAALDQEPPLRLDLAGVEELDTAGLQLLVWLKQEARRRGRPLTLSGHSPAVLDVFERLQVADLFGDPIILASTASRG